jgi:hypothetical protein
MGFTFFHIVSKSDQYVSQDKASIQRWLMWADGDGPGHSQVAKPVSPGSKDAPDAGGAATPHGGVEANDCP